jgi:6-phosphogluconate dehydrogenase
VFARCLSAIKDERVAASLKLKGPNKLYKKDKAKFIAQLHDALYASKICSYAQGFQLLRAASEEHGWKLKYGEIALLWRGGCIIRAQFLDSIKAAFGKRPKLANLLLDPHFRRTMGKAQKSWRSVVKTAIDLGIPVPSMGSALAYYDSYRNARLPANLLQAQRDYFGAHQYERIDKPRGEFFHTDWTGQGGKTASSTYVV